MDSSLKLRLGYSIIQVENISEMKMNIKLGEIFAHESFFFVKRYAKARKQVPNIEINAKACKEDDHNY